MDDPLANEWDKASVDFPLNEESVVLEVGGFRGRWAWEIAKRFNPHLYIYEPQTDIGRALREQIDPLFPKAQVVNYGLGVESGVFRMKEMGTDGCSFLPGESVRGTIGQGMMVEIGEELAHFDCEIDLMLMNIEGYEFKLIPYMLERGLFAKIKYFMCQFHPEGEGGVRAFVRIFGQMKEIYNVRFDYGPVLIAWERK